jgi:hypothetical protein
MSELYNSSSSLTPLKNRPSDTYFGHCTQKLLNIYNYCNSLDVVEMYFASIFASAIIGAFVGACRPKYILGCFNNPPRFDTLIEKTFYCAVFGLGYGTLFASLFPLTIPATIGWLINKE